MKRFVALILLLSSLSFAQTKYARMIQGVNKQTGTTYTFTAADGSMLTTFSNSAPVAVNLPAGTTRGFGKGSIFSVQNLGTSAVTITCTSCLIFATSPIGAATLVLSSGSGADIYSDGLNYYSVLGGGGGISNLPTTCTPNQTSVWDGSQWTCSNAGTGTISGTGSATRVALFSDAATLAFNPNLSMVDGILQLGSQGGIDGRMLFAAASGAPGPVLTIQPNSAPSTVYLPSVFGNAYLVGTATPPLTIDPASGNISLTSATTLNWSQPSTTALAAGVSRSVTLTPCPSGIDYTSGVGYQVYITDGGSSETVNVTAGSGSGATCSITFTPFFSHTSYTIGSASSGLQETINAACGVDPTQYKNAQCNVVIPANGPGNPTHTLNTYNVQGTIFYHANQSTLSGYGVSLNCIGRGACIQIGDRVSSNNFSANVLSGFSFRTPTALSSNPSFAGVNVTSTIRTSQVVTITTDVAHGFRTGDMVTILFTDSSAYWGDAVVTSTPTSTSFTYAHTGSNISLQTTPGVVALAYSAVLDNGGSSHLLDLSYDRVGENGQFNNFFDLWDDENATIEHFNNNGIGLWAGPNWMGSFVFSAGNQGSLNQIAPVITVRDSQITANYSSGVTVYNSNGVYVDNTVIQGSGLWQVYSSNTTGNYQGAQIRNLYSESSVTMNPLSPARTPFAGTGIAGLIAGGSTAAARFSVSGANPGGGFATGGSGATPLAYFIVANDVTQGIQTSPMQVLTWSSTGSDSPVVRWPRVANGTDTITYDVLRSSFSANAIGAVYPGKDQCGGGSTTACGSVITGQAQCSGLVCSFTDSAAATTSPYTVKVGNYNGGLHFWPGSIVSVNTPVTTDVDSGNVVGVGLGGGPILVSRKCENYGGLGPGGYTVCLASHNPINSAPNQTAMVMNDGASAGGGVALSKGRLNFLQSPWTNLQPHHIITLVDSQPGLTQSTFGMRPPASTTDVWIGTDVPANAVQLTQGQLAFGAPVAISSYLGNVGNNTSWLERLTTAKKEFNVAVQFDSSISMPSLSDGCLDVTSGLFGSTASPCLGYPETTGTQVVTSTGSAWGTPLSLSGAGTSLLTVTGTPPGAGAAWCGDGSNGATGTGCTTGTGNVSSTGTTPVDLKMAQWASGTQIRALDTTGTGNAVLADSPTLVTPDLGVATATSINGIGILGTAGKSLTMAASLQLNGTDNSTLNVGTGGTLGTGAFATIADYVPTTTTVNGHALSGDVSITTTDLSLNNLTNDAQTKAAIVPNTVPAAGQVLVGNAGGTAFGPVSLSQDANLAASGSLAVVGLRQHALPSLPGTDRYLHYNGGWQFTDPFDAATFINGLTLSTGSLTLSALGAGTQCLHAVDGVVSVSGTGECGTSSGNVAAVGTPSSGQFALWTSGTDIQGVSGTGSGTPVLNTSPTFVTPVLGAASATSINGLSLTSNPTGFQIAGGSTSKTFIVQNNLTLAGNDGATLNIAGGGTLGSAAFSSIANFVLTSTTVNGHPLSSSVTVTPTDLSLNNVTNDAQTKAAIVPNTVPSAGQLLIGSGTAYTPQTLSQDASVTSGGVWTNTGIRGKTINLPGSDQYLHYTGSAWAFTNPFASPTFTGAITLPFTGTQCLHEVNGVLGVTGVDCGAGGGSGTVSNGAAGAIGYYAAAGTTISGSPATTDAGGNISATSYSTPASTAAAVAYLGQGSAQALGSNSVGLTAPTSVTSYNLVFPGSASSGFIKWANGSNTVTGSWLSGIGITDLSATGTTSSTTCLYGDNTWKTCGAGGMTWPAAAGIMVYAGASAYGTSLTAPSGAIVGTTDTQALTGKTYNGLTISTSTGTLSVADGKTFTASNSLTLSGTDGASLNLNNAVTQAANGTNGFIATYGASNKALVASQYLPASAEPAHTGDVTNTAGTVAMTVAGVGGAAVPTSCGTVLNTNASKQLTCNATPAIGAATATSLAATGVVDGKAGVTVTTSTPVTLNAYLSGYWYNQHATAGTAIVYNLPTAAAGLQKCVANSYNGSAANTGTLRVNASAAGQFIIFSDGTLSATGGYVISGGAAGDKACFVGVDATHWMFYSQQGTWTKN